MRTLTCVSGNMIIIFIELISLLSFIGTRSMRTPILPNWKSLNRGHNLGKGCKNEGDSKCLNIFSGNIMLPTCSQKKVMSMHIAQQMQSASSRIFRYWVHNQPAKGVAKFFIKKKSDFLFLAKYTHNWSFHCEKSL